MSEETLHSAARRLLRFLRIDEVRGGGIISIETFKAMDTLDIQITKENERIQREKNNEVQLQEL